MPLTLYYGTEMRKGIAHSILYRITYGLLFCCFLLSSHSESIAQKYDKLRFERFTIEQGLSSDRVIDITQDHLGYIWIATESGVSRYDGYDFKVYRSLPAESTTLSDNNTTAIHADRYGKLWVGTTIGLNLYDPVSDSFERIYHNPDDSATLPSNSINRLFETKNGDLWVATSNGLSLYDRANHTFINEWQINGSRIDFKGISILALTQDDSGTLWIGTAGIGLIAFNPDNQILRFFEKDPIPGLSFPTATVTNVLADSFGYIWIAFLALDNPTGNVRSQVSVGGLGRLDPKTYSFTMFKYHPVSQPGLWDMISDIIETEDGTLWVATYFQNDLSGLHRFDRQTEKFIKYSYDPYDTSSLSWAFANAIFADRFNNVWVGTSRGLNKADLGKWQMGLFRFRPDIPGNMLDNIYGIEEVDDDVFWFALDGPGMIEWNRNTGKIRNFDPIDPFTDVYDIDVLRSATPVVKKDLSGEIWIGDGGYGLRRINRKTKQVVNYVSDENNPGSISGNYISGILVDETNSVWLATTDGLNRYNRSDDTFTSWTKKNSQIGSNSLYTIFKDSHGIIWLGTRTHLIDPRPTISEGLISFDPSSESFQIYKYVPGAVNSLSSNAINAIDEDLEGNIWIATNNGLNRFNRTDHTFEHLNVKEGLPDAVVVALVFDNEGMLWLSTLNGLSQFNPKTGVFRNFDKSYGVQENRFNDYAYLKTSDGELLFGGIAGVNYFYPSDIFENSIAPVVHLTQMLVNNSPFALSQPIHEIGNVVLNWGQNSVGFEFTAISFRSPELTVYEFKLEGYDSEWISSGTRRFTNYTNLPPNDYVFSVRAVGADGVISTDVASVSIRIKPPFWRTWWAYGFYAIMFAGVVFGVDRTQRRRLIQKERERTRELELAQAKEIEQAYNNLEVAHENLKSAQSQLIQQEKLASLGQLTAGIAHEIKNPLNFVNNFSNVSLEMIDEALEEVHQIGQNEHATETAAILSDIKINLQKIHEHGSRADGIVKSMLQHSRGGSGKMEPTDLNALVTEFTNLAYHGMRAGNNPIDAEITLDLDESVGEVPLVYEDFSRVILNISSNAFDALRGSGISDRGSATTPKASNFLNDGAVIPEGPSPQVTGGAVIPNELSSLPQVTGGGHAHLQVRTRRETNRITIEIEDNGPGIPDEIKDKILQPFFTTKKGTQGTGLGLSITHDIIKAHGGELDIQSQPGKTIFSLTLPC